MFRKLMVTFKEGFWLLGPALIIIPHLEPFIFTNSQEDWSTDVCLQSSDYDESAIGLFLAIHDGWKLL